MILVTGATGLVGNNVVRLLVERGQRVRALVRPGCDPRPLAGLPIETAPGDVCQAGSLQAACRGVRGVIHAAGHVHIGHRGLERHRQINVVGTCNVARAAREAGAAMVYVSSVNALGIGSLRQPATEETPPGGYAPIPYVATKREADRAILDEVERGLRAMIVHPGFMLGPWDWKPSSGQLLLAVGKRKALVAPPGWFDVCDVRDVAAAILTALEEGTPGRRYITAGPATRYGDAMRLFAQVTGARAPWTPRGPIVMAVAGRAGDLWAAISGREPAVNSAALAMARLEKSYSSDRAAAELGYRTRPMEETVRDAWNWFREHGYAR